jgi:ABC-type glycerol-3-phosphate transport system permease component
MEINTTSIITEAIVSTAIGISWTKTFPPLQWLKAKVFGYDRHSTDIIFGLPDKPTIRDYAQIVRLRLLGCTACVSLWVSVGIGLASVAEVQDITSIIITAMTAYALARQVDQYVD